MIFSVYLYNHYVIITKLISPFVCLVFFALVFLFFKNLYFSSGVWSIPIKGSAIPFWPTGWSEYKSKDLIDTAWITRFPDSSGMPQSATTKYEV